jgi:sugar phosphate isomerase/epimerase
MSLSFGVCLFSVYSELHKDYLKTLERIAAIGFENVELLANDPLAKQRFDLTVPLKTMKSKFAELKLNIISTHETVPMGDDLLAQDWDAIINFNAELGCKRIVIPAVWIKNREDTLRNAEKLNVLGLKCRANGEQLYLHTHSHEFKHDGQDILYDLLIDNTDPAYLKFQVDMAWTMRGGIDPLYILKKLGNRCDMVHQKDISKQANPVNLFEVIKPEDDQLGVLEVYQKYVKRGDFVDLGDGIFDFARVYQGIKEMGHVQYTFTENEGINTDRFASIEQDYHLIKKYV